MPTPMRRSRWDTSTRLDEKGKPVPLIFNGRDLEICKLFSPVLGIREPWSYQYLPTGYVAPLLDRGQSYMVNRLQELMCEPHAYLSQTDQPKNNFRDIIYSIGTNGLDELRETGAVIPRKPLRRLEHELMASIIGASFEYGTMTKKGVKIETVEETRAMFWPDWPIFWYTTPHQQKKVYIEADRGTMRLEHHPTDTNIYDKFANYLSLEDIKDCLVVFVTVRHSRVDGMIECLKKAIDEGKHSHTLARSFAFTHLPYDRFLMKIPKLTDWALKEDYQRAGYGPFNFLKE